MVAQVAGAGPVLDVAVLVGVAVRVAPRQGALGGGQELAPEHAIARPLHRLGEQHREERRRVHGAVVRTVGDLAQAGELAAPELVEDLPGRLLGERIHLRALVAREQAQGAAGDVRIPGEGLVRGDQAIAAERDGVPRDPGGDVQAGVLGVDQRSQVQRAAQDELVVERLRARREIGAAPKEPAVARVEGVQGLIEVPRRGRGARAVLARHDGELVGHDLPRRELALEDEGLPLDPVGRRTHRHVGRAAHAVAPEPLEPDAARDGLDAGGLRRRGKAAVAADGEHVAERRIELDLDPEPDLLRIAVQDADALAEAVHQEPRAADG